MKKLLLLAVAILLLAGCSGVKREVKWYNNFDDALKVAQKVNLPILLLVTSDMDTTDSRAGTKYLLGDEFVTSVGDKYVCVHFDFTDLKAKMAEVPEDATAQEQKLSESNKAALMKQFNIADAFSVTSTPAVCIASKEGYYICTVDFDWHEDTLKPYTDKLLEVDTSVVAFCDQLVKVKKGATLEEKIAAIDAIYDAASENHRLLLIPLYDEVLRLDKNNKTGKVSKYITAKANAMGHNYLLNRDVDKAIETYEKAATDKRIAPDDKQMLYYIAANVLGNAQTGKTDKIIELLENAIAAAPDSDYVTNLRQLLDYVKQMAGIQVEPDSSNETNTEVSDNAAPDTQQNEESQESNEAQAPVAPSDTNEEVPAENQ